MIFITLGSQKFQFNRLLIKIDELLEAGIIQEEVFAQVGASNYVPKNFKCKDYLNRDEFQEILKKSNLVITHGGTGAIVTAIKNHKKVIAVARKAQFKEHVDDHQEQIVDSFTYSNYILGITNFDEFENVLKKIRTHKFDRFESNTDVFIKSIEDYLNK